MNKNKVSTVFVSAISIIAICAVIAAVEFYKKNKTTAVPAGALSQPTTEDIKQANALSAAPPVAVDPNHAAPTQQQAQRAPHLPPPEKHKIPTAEEIQKQAEASKKFIDENKKASDAFLALSPQEQLAKAKEDLAFVKARGNKQDLFIFPKELLAGDPMLLTNMSYQMSLARVRKEIEHRKK